MNNDQLVLLLSRADLMLDLERWQDAKSLLQQALVIAPEEPVVLSTLARVLSILGEPGEALKLATQLLLAAPQDPDSHAVMVELALQRSDIDQAHASNDAWLQLAPDDFAAQASACRIHLHRGHRIQALRMADNIRRAFAHVAEAHLLHAYCAQSLMRIRLLRESAERALQLEPQNPEAILLTGRAWAYKTRTELQAVELLANGCALYPENEEMREELDSAVNFYVGSATICAIAVILFPPSLFYVLWDFAFGRRLRIRKLTPTVKDLVRRRLRIKNTLVLRRVGIVFGLITLGISTNQLVQGEYVFDISSLGLCVAALLALVAGSKGYRQAHQRAKF